MIHFSLSRSAANRNPFRDAVGILLLLVLGIGGLLFVFSIPDPFTALAPQTPLLSPADWPGSYASIGFGISTGGEWQEQREFSTSLVLNRDTDYAEIEQTAIWYASRIKAAASWNQLNTGSYNQQPMVASDPGGDRPATMLFCNENAPPDEPRECWYLAAWGHWYTAVRYWNQPPNEGGDSPELQRITARVNQLLMSAPEEPCYGILCTGTENGVKP